MTKGDIMKGLSFILSALILGAAVYAADLSSKSTDELLKMRGTMTTEQERNQLHNELKIREKTMTQEQLKSFHTYPPENRVPKYQNKCSGQGMGGSGQGMGGGGGKNR